MYIIFPLIIFILNFFSPKNQNLELKYFNSDYYYYNLVSSENGVLIGSDQGVFKVFENEIELLDQSIIGPLALDENSKIKSGEALYSDQYKYLLPNVYQSALQTFLETPTELYIVSRGDLFVFKKASFSLENYPSIRTISENYIGTYDGIFNRFRQKEFVSLTYTNSYVREFDSIVFINWDGLTIQLKGQTKNYYDKNGEGLSIKGQLLGLANDVVLLSYPEFLLLTTRGLYQFNIQSEDLKLLRSTTSGPMAFIRDETNSTGVERIFFHDRESVIVFNTESKAFNEIIKENDILDVFSTAASVFFVLTKSSLNIYNLDKSKSPNRVIPNIDNYHTLGYFKDFIFLSSDNGLSLYNIKDGRLARQTIKDEFNRKASFISQDTLYLGSVNGLYSLDYNAVNDLFLQTVEPYPKRKLPWFLYVIGFAFITIVFLSLWIYRISNSKRIEASSVFSERNIINFIKKNLGSVTIEMICLEFNVNQNEVYKILSDGRRPGEIIRKERVKLVREMRSKNKSEEEISKASGFSISYLKKI